MIQLIVSILLYFVIFFGIAFIVNMLLRRTWLMACLYPIIIIMMIDGMPTTAYFKAPGESFSKLGEELATLAAADITILISGFVGTIVSGIVIKLLRKSGYQMF
ncbi:YuiB family protein [Virgibacillus sp. 179-BFC.A HS]|uniref:YuiB family protein n=1 Tax=Tigheibacillus jepli TaxID=3035914 RepID=A0ABU5CIA0_9BACI|nr:YuiB family protein [Virgibacillus sp. 179-BFC.A HS]MDY0405248.1 YuiB family protein [Virgibacillus sp. 179-BFC.A HS]